MQVHHVPPRFDRATREELRQRLLQRGELLATLLADVLAGGERVAELAALGFEGTSRRAEDFLRDAMNQVERRRRLLVSGDDRYGRCDVCGEALELAALLATPWADRCTSHLG